MIGEAAALGLLDRILRGGRADQAQAILIGSDRGLTRMANGVIHQHVAEQNAEVICVAVRGKRLGTASTNSLKLGDLRRCFARAARLADLQPENPDFHSLPGPARPLAVETHFEATARCSPRQRAQALRGAAGQARRLKLSLAGAFATGEGEIAVANSLGAATYQAFTTAEVNLVATSDDSGGYAYALHRDIRRVDPAALAERALAKCAASRQPRKIPAGRYDVILEPPAVAELLEWMNIIGFGARTLEDGTSFLTGRLGERITGEQVTILDDGLDPEGLPMPFDFEGVPRQRVPLIEGGIARGVVYDSLTAGKVGRVSTGHALPPGSEGPFALNLFMTGGDRPMPALIEQVERGVLVTRFHYVNGLLDTRRALMTGMTRDGTFWIEGGKVRHPLKNLRFTEGVLEAFARIGAVSRDRWIQGGPDGGIGAIVAPALLIRDFNFSGETEF